MIDFAGLVSRITGRGVLATVMSEKGVATGDSFAALVRFAAETAPPATQNGLRLVVDNAPPPNPSDPAAPGDLADALAPTIDTLPATILAPATAHLPASLSGGNGSESLEEAAGRVYEMSAPRHVPKAGASGLPTLDGPVAHEPALPDDIIADADPVPADDGDDAAAASDQPAGTVLRAPNPSDTMAGALQPTPLVPIAASQPAPLAAPAPAADGRAPARPVRPDRVIVARPNDLQPPVMANLPARPGGDAAPPVASSPAGPKDLQPPVAAHLSASADGDVALVVTAPPVRPDDLPLPVTPNLSARADSDVALVVAASPDRPNDLPPPVTANLSVRTEGDVAPVVTGPPDRPNDLSLPVTANLSARADSDAAPVVAAPPARPNDLPSSVTANLSAHADGDVAPGVTVSPVHPNDLPLPVVANLPARADDDAAPVTIAPPARLVDAFVPVEADLPSSPQEAAWVGTEMPARPDQETMHFASGLAAPSMPPVLVPTAGTATVGSVTARVAAAVMPTIEQPPTHPAAPIRVDDVSPKDGLADPAFLDAEAGRALAEIGAGIASPQMTQSEAPAVAEDIATELRGALSGLRVAGRLMPPPSASSPVVRQHQSQVDGRHAGAGSPAAGDRADMNVASLIGRKSEDVPQPAAASPGLDQIADPLAAVASQRGMVAPSGSTERPTLSTATVVPPAQDATADTLDDRVIDMGVSGQWIDRMAREIATLAQGGGHGRFVLNPPHLGRLDVEVALDRDVANIRMTAETDEAARRLNDARPAMQADGRLTALAIGSFTIEKAHGQSDLARDQDGGQRAGGELAGQMQQQSGGGQGQASGRPADDQRRGDWTNRFTRNETTRQGGEDAPASARNGGDGRVRFA